MAWLESMGNSEKPSSASFASQLASRVWFLSLPRLVLIASSQCGVSQQLQDPWPREPFRSGHVSTKGGVYNDRSRFPLAPVYVIAGTRIGLANCRLGRNQHAGRSGSSSCHGWPGAPSFRGVAGGGTNVLYSLGPRVHGGAGPEPHE